MKNTISILILLLVILIISCSEKKPDFIPSEDFSYLKNKNKVLFVVRLVVDTIDDDEYPPDKKVNDLIKNTDFISNFREKLVKEIYKYDSKHRLDIDIFSDKYEDRSNEYIKYVRRKYPDTIADQKYNLILELDVHVLISYEYFYIDLSKREQLRLIDAKSNKVYISSNVFQTYRSVARKLKLLKNEGIFIYTLQELINRSTMKMAKYLLNLEKKPSYKDITPALPEIK